MSINVKVCAVIGVLALASALYSAAPPQQVTAAAPFTYPTIASSSFCAALGSSGSAACVGSPAGFIAIPAGSAVNFAVDTTAVTSNSQIFIQYDESVTIPSVTCNVTSAARSARYFISARSGGTSFTITASAIPATGNPVCLSYSLVN